MNITSFQYTLSNHGYLLFLVSYVRSSQFQIWRRNCFFYFCFLLCICNLTNKNNVFNKRACILELIYSFPRSNKPSNSEQFQITNISLFILDSLTSEQQVFSGLTMQFQLFETNVFLCADISHFITLYCNINDNKRYKLQVK